MGEIDRSSFGLVIAYLLPGFVALWGVSYFSPTVRLWFGAAPSSAPTVGGFLYVTLGSIALGLLVSTIRWLMIDPIHHHTGIPEPRWNFANMQEKFAAFEGLVENHFRYYQLHANLFVAIAFSSAACVISTNAVSSRQSWWPLAFLLVEAVLWLGSRDTLRKYYDRSSMLLQHANTADK